MKLFLNLNGPAYKRWEIKADEHIPRTKRCSATKEWQRKSPHRPNKVRTRYWDTDVIYVMGGCLFMHPDLAAEFRERIKAAGDELTPACSPRHEGK